MRKKLHILIPFYQGHEVINACIQSIRVAAQGFNYTIIIIDNSPTRCSLKNQNDLQIITAKPSIGFARAMNIGVYQSSEAEFFLILNQDAILEKNCIQAFFKSYTEANDPTSLYSPFLKNYSLQKPNLIFENLTLNKFSTIHQDLNNRSLKERYKIQFASGAALFFSRDFVNQHQLFDPNFYLYGEDDDLCFRVLKNGSHVLLCSHAIVGHNSGFEESNEAAKTQRRIYKRNANVLLRLKHPTKYQDSAFQYRNRSLLKALLTLNFKGIREYITFDKTRKVLANGDLKHEILKQIELDLNA